MKELRLDNVCDMQAGNAFLPEFLERLNEKFSVRAAKPEDLHRRLALTPNRLSDILCHREQRHVGQQLTLAYDRKQLILERSAISEELGGQYLHPHLCRAKGICTLFPALWHRARDPI